ncbi:MAG: hypothetical protein L0Y44_04010 [Phycisphaerales bacterium]|nr:hypothetical protein [Phycisphaerales bacterium]
MTHELAYKRLCEAFGMPEPRDHFDRWIIQPAGARMHAVHVFLNKTGSGETTYALIFDPDATLGDGFLEVSLDEREDIERLVAQLRRVASPEAREGNAFRPLSS